MRLRILVAILVSSSVGCAGNDDPASYVAGLRVLAIRADPPEIPAGASSTLTALAIDTQGTPIDISWAQCLDTALQGDAVNPACITSRSADYLDPIGSGLSVMTTMPAVDPSSLSRPDASGGVYLPLIARATAGADSLTAAYLLRLGLGTPPNKNPILSGLFRVSGSSGAGDNGAGEVLTTIDDSSPLVVHAGEQVTLRATFAPGSTEVYQIYDGAPGTTPPRSVTETLSVSWFSTAGTFADATSGADVRDTVFHLDQSSTGPSVHLPPSGTIIDLWIVGRDERGGADFLHRALQFE